MSMALPQAAIDPLPPPIRSVFHPTDLSPKSSLAFLHALKIALVRRTRFEIMHLSEQGKAWHDFPSVRATLERWGVLAPGSPRSSVLTSAGIDVTKVSSRRRRGVLGMVAYLRDHPSDMLVLATAGRRGLAQLLRPSFGERLVRRVRTGTLFVTAGARGFVDPADGSVRLRNVLAFVDQAAMAQTVGEMVARVLLTVDAVPARLVLAHTAPVPVRMPGDDRWRWERRAVGAPVVDNLLAVAAEIDADLIIAAAKRRLSPFAWWFGSTAERVVRRAQCPVLMLPPI